MLSRNLPLASIIVGNRVLLIIRSVISGHCLQWLIITDSAAPNTLARLPIWKNEFNSAFLQSTAQQLKVLASALVWPSFYAALYLRQCSG
jgi:hypothetical protein